MENENHLVNSPFSILNYCKQKENRFRGSLSLSKKPHSTLSDSCGSTHKVEFAQQIHKFREHVSRNLYKGRKNVPAGRGFSSVSLESVVSSERLLGKR